VLLNLFNTARRFNMQVQPQLVLLQKTLLYIEGLGRQLYPQLDLWQTAKPFLERWIRKQIGPQAAWQAIKEKAPFWAEKLPEMPDLVYDALTQIQHQQHLMQGLYQQQHKHQRRNAQAQYMLGTGAALLLSSVLLFPVHQTTAISGLIISALCWLRGWWKLSRR